MPTVTLAPPSGLAQLEHRVAARPDDPKALRQLLVAYRQGGRGADADRLMARSLAGYPHRPDLLMLATDLALADRHLPAAERHNRHARVLAPADGNLIFQQSRLAEGQGDGARRRALLRRAHVLVPQSALPLIGLAQVEMDAGRPARQVLRHALVRTPGHPRALALRAQEMQRQDTEAAIPYLNRALVVDPVAPLLWFALARALLNADSHRGCLIALKRLLRLRPGTREAHDLAAQAWRGLKQADAAVRCARRALVIAPDYAQALTNGGVALHEAGRSAEAERYYDRNLLLAPNAVHVLANRANLMKHLGRMAEAEAGYRTVLARNPQSTHTAVSLMDVHKCRPGDPLLDDLKKRLDDSRLTDSQRAPLHFALGKGWDDCGDPDRAMTHYIAGNRLDRQAMTYDVADDIRRLTRCAELFTPDFLARHEGHGHPSRRPILIVGMPRSGTTLVEQILSSHPQVFGAGELYDLKRLALIVAPQLARRPQDRYPEWVPGLTPQLCHDLGRRYLATIDVWNADHPHLTDKMPENFMFAGLIHLILPNAVIIHCRRNPVDTCISCFTRRFTGGIPYAFDLSDLGRFYRAYHDLMAHWHRVLPAGRILDVVYEETVADTETMARRILDHCGLPWDDACLRFHENRRQVITASVSQVRKPIYGSSVARWRKYQAHLGPLLDALGPDLVPGDGGV